jgi:DNA polymerase-4
MQRLVCHVDMDAFFVSVEELFDPSLKGKPVVVGGKADQRGVVAAASYAARKFGVHSAMPLRTAARLCPHAIFVDGHPERYREYSKKIFMVLQRFSPQVEEARFLAPLEVRKIPGVGKKTEEALHSIGIWRVGDLAALDENFLASRFGKWGLALAGKARGEDAGGWFDEEIGVGGDPKSISHEHTFGEDTNNREQLETTLLRLAEMVAQRLREHGLYARTIHLKLRYEDFSTITRALTLDHATQLDGEIAGAVMRLFRQAWDTLTPVRLLGVYSGGLQQAEGQMNLLEEPRTARLREAFRSVDHIRNRFGTASVSLAKTLGAGIRERVHENPADLPGKRGEKP